MLQVLEQCQDRRCKILEIFPRFKMNPIHSTVSQTVFSFAREQVCGFLTQMQFGYQPSSSGTTVLERNIYCYSSLMERLDITQYTYIIIKKYQCKCSSIMLNSTVLSLSQQQLLTSFSICRRFSIQWRPPLISHHSGTLTSWRGKMI